MNEAARNCKPKSGLGLLLLGFNITMYYLMIYFALNIIIICKCRHFRNKEISNSPVINNSYKKNVHYLQIRCQTVIMEYTGVGVQRLLGHRTNINLILEFTDHPLHGHITKSPDAMVVQAFCKLSLSTYLSSTTV